MSDPAVVSISAVLSAMLIGVVRSYALRNALVDHPTERSSHTSATPRGGGLGLIIAVVVAWVLGTSNWIPGMSLALVGITVVVALGWLDDHKSLRVGPRLIFHLLAALCLIPLALQSNSLPTWLGYSATVWWLFWGVSAVNVINFMDGIDGLIGSQMLVYGVHLATLGTAGESAHLLGLALAGGCTGFLFWNWPPARVFLGDVGSGTLGLIAVLGGLLLLREGNTGLLAAFLPLYPVFLDATVTLVRRIARREQITSAHRTHLYQRLANGGWGHAKVASLYCAGAVLGLIVAHSESRPAWPIIVLAYALLPLVAGYKLERIVPYPTFPHK